jgi:murein DD-endopeptidase MepM/ murein hydrolase activator NlpD
MTVVRPVRGDVSRWYIEVGYLATGSWYGGRRDIHTGWDWNLRTGGNSDVGQDVVSVADGEVIFVGNLTTWGGVVWVRHPQFGVRTRYAHITNFTVQVGQWVTADQKLGEIARMSAWPSHLHFDVTEKALGFGHWCFFDRACVERSYVDTLEFFTKHGVTVPRETGGKRLSWSQVDD